MSPAVRRLTQGTGAALLLLALGLVVLPRLGGGPAGVTDSSRTFLSGTSGTSGDSLPLLGEAPAFSLTDQTGKTFGREDLRGKVWVADFVFTRCPAVCPILSRAMSGLQEATSDAGLAGETRFVSFSVDPEHDTPEVLRAYAERHDADPDRWHLLTGEREEIWSISRDGFKLLVDDNRGDPGNPILHSQRLLLMDRDGAVRGMYDGTIPEEVAALERELLRLASPISGDL